MPVVGGLSWAVGQSTAFFGCSNAHLGFLLDIHNETVNIHTHLLGSITVLPYLVDHLLLHSSDHPTLRWQDTFHFTVFLVSAAVCLGFSATYHTLSCHSRKISKRWNQLDYVGIVFLIVGSNFPAIYYGFYCDQFLQWFYICVSTFLFVSSVFTIKTEHYF